MYRLTKPALKYVLMVTALFFCFIVVTRIAIADDVTVTGAVSPKPSDVDFSLSGVPTTSTTLHETDIVTMTITYRSNLAGSEDFQIQGSWEKGLIDGSINNYVDALNYVVGSATVSDDGTVPTIDLLNRRVTWGIANLAPSSAYHTVSFSLRVPDSLPTLLPLNTPIHAQGQIIDTLLPVETLTYTIQGILEPTVTPTLTPNPTSTPTPGANLSTVTTTPSVTATPTATQQLLTINTVSIRSISESSATIFFSTSEPTTYRVQFGPLSDSLSQQASGTLLRSSHTVQLANLTPGTDYAFRIVATNSNGLTTRSDLFTLMTAQLSETVPVVKENISITWQQIPISQSTSDIIVLPYQEPITASVRIPDPKNIAFILMRFQNAHILGVGTSETMPAVEEVRLMEVVPGTFTGELAAPRSNGEYQLVLEIHTTAGGIEIKALPYKVFVSPALHVVNGMTEQGVENASITIERFVQRQNQYIPLERSFALNSHTDNEGMLRLVLPAGTYRLGVSAPGYKPQTIVLHLGYGDNTYPRITLVSSSEFMDRVSYHMSAVANTSRYVVGTLKTFFSSSIAQEATFTMLTIAAIFLSLIILGYRMNVSVLGILYFPISLLVRIFIKSHGDYYTFHISEHNPFGKRIAGAVMLLVSHEGKVLWKSNSDPRGSAHVPKKILGKSAFPIKIFVYRPGYYAYPIELDQSSFGEQSIQLVMEHEKIEVRSVKTFVRWFINETRFVISDVMMALTVLLVLLFTYFHGFFVALPMLTITSVLIFVWFVYVLHRFEHEVSETTR